MSPTLAVATALVGLMTLSARPAVTSVVLASPQAAARGAGTTTADGWPNTASGALARRWVEAFSKGERAMRATLPQILSAESLAKSSMDERMERYRRMRDQLGALMLVKIEKTSATEIVAKLAAEDLSQHAFTFKFQGQAPFKLVSVSTVQRRHMHGGGFSH